MRHQFIFLVAVFSSLVALSTTNSSSAVNPTNLTVEKTQTNATVLVENETNVSQPRIPVMVLPENLTVPNSTVANISGR